VRHVTLALDAWHTLHCRGDRIDASSAAEMDTFHLHCRSPSRISHAELPLQHSLMNAYGSGRSVSASAAD
jgi:hypothetical protein